MVSMGERQHVGDRVIDGVGIQLDDVLTVLHVLYVHTDVTVIVQALYFLRPPHCASIRLYFHNLINKDESICATYFGCTV